MSVQHGGPLYVFVCVLSSKLILDPDRIRQYLHGQESIVDEIHNSNYIALQIYTKYIVTSIVVNS